MKRIRSNRWGFYRRRVGGGVFFKGKRSQRNRQEGRPGGKEKASMIKGAAS